MKNKKGFTLLELLAVLVLLALIAIIAIPAVTNVIKGSKEDISKAQMDNIKHVLDNYIAMHADTLSDGDEICISDLKREGLLTNKDITDPNTGSTIDDCFKISWSDVSNQFVYDYSNVGSKAYFITGPEVNQVMSNWNEVSDFKKASAEPSNIKKAKKPSELSDIDENSIVIVSTDNSPEKIYMWYDESDYTIYWWSKANANYLNPDSSYMFNHYWSDIDLDLSNVNTKYVTNISHMFDSVYTLNISNWDLSNVTKYAGFLNGSPSGNEGNFEYVSGDYDYTIIADNLVLPASGGWLAAALTSGSHNDLLLNINSWDTSHVVDATSMFSNLEDIESIDISKWDLSNVTNVSYMFFGTNVDNISLKNFDTSNIENFNHFFDGVDADTLDISGVDFSGAKYFSCYYGEDGCLFYQPHINHLISSNIVLPPDCSYTAYDLYDYNSELEIVGMDKWDTSKVTNMEKMFYNSRVPGDLDLSKWDTSKVTNISNMFEFTDISGDLNLSGWDMSKTTNTNYMFESANISGDLNVSNWKISKNTSLNGVFEYSSIYGALNISNWDLSKYEMNSCTDYGSGCGMYYHFGYNGSNLIANNLKLPSNSSYFVYGISNVEGVDTWDTSKVTDMSHMFDYSGISGDLDLSSWDTSKVTNMESMFSDSSYITSLDLSSWDTSKVTNMRYMFGYCSSLQTIYASDKFVTTSVTDDDYMFDSVYNLVGGNGTRFEDELVYDKSYARIDIPGQKGYFTAKTN